MDLLTPVYRVMTFNHHSRALLPYEWLSAFCCRNTRRSAGGGAARLLGLKIAGVLGQMELLLRPRPLCRFELDRERSNTWKKGNPPLPPPAILRTDPTNWKKGDNYYNPDDLRVDLKALRSLERNDLFYLRLIFWVFVFLCIFLN